MSKRIFILIVIMVSLVSFELTADDGSWSNSFSISGGSVYSEEESSDIVLEKELLIFNGEYTEAHFLFRNTTDRDIEMVCGFPVVNRIDVWLSDGYAEIQMSKYGGDGIPGLRFFETVKHPEWTDDEPMFVYPEVIPLNKFNQSRNFLGPDIPGNTGLDFSIKQDGIPLAVEDILLEREVNEVYAGLTFHFKHRLNFPAGGTSSVSVRYTQDLLCGNDGGAAADVYKWNYLIGTGRTWKGPIGEFYFVKPICWEGEPSGMSRVGKRLPGGVDVYYAAGYEPDIDEMFNLTCRPVGLMKEYEFYDYFPEQKRWWMERILSFPDAKEPVQDFVKKVKSSSFLEDHVSVFSDNGVIESASFGPNAAFDGMPETSWCENAEGYGEGEYLEVSITEPVSGVIVRNGFKRFTVDDWVFDSGAFERVVEDPKNGLKDYFTMNSRVKSLEIRNKDGSFSAVLDLEDKRDPQAFFAVDLNPGTYQFIIKDVYQGSKWQDTCIAEITFIPHAAEGPISRLFTDQFYSNLIGTRIFK